ncbi:MAG: listerin E3 ubiquitin protein ligase 1 [Marteilia pararefringens]
MINNKGSNKKKVKNQTLIDDNVDDDQCDADCGDIATRQLLLRDLNDAICEISGSAENIGLQRLAKLKSGFADTFRRASDGGENINQLYGQICELNSSELFSVSPSICLLFKYCSLSLDLKIRLQWLNTLTKLVNANESLLNSCGHIVFPSIFFIALDDNDSKNSIIAKKLLNQRLSKELTLPYFEDFISIMNHLFETHFKKGSIKSIYDPYVKMILHLVIGNKDSIENLKRLEIYMHPVLLANISQYIDIRVDNLAKLIQYSFKYNFCVPLITKWLKNITIDSSNINHYFIILNSIPVEIFESQEFLQSVIDNSFKCLNHLHTLSIFIMDKNIVKTKRVHAPIYNFLKRLYDTKLMETECFGSIRQLTETLLEKLIDASMHLILHSLVCECFVETLQLIASSFSEDCGIAKSIFIISFQKILLETMLKFNISDRADITVLKKFFEAFNTIIRFIGQQKLSDCSSGESDIGKNIVVDFMTSSDRTNELKTFTEIIKFCEIKSAIFDMVRDEMIAYCFKSIRERCSMKSIHHIALLIGDKNLFNATIDSNTYERILKFVKLENKEIDESTLKDVIVILTHSLEDVDDESLLETLIIIHEYSSLYHSTIKLLMDNSKSDLIKIHVNNMLDADNFSSKYSKLNHLLSYLQCFDDSKMSAFEKDTPIILHLFTSICELLKDSDLIINSDLGDFSSISIHYFSNSQLLDMIMDVKESVNLDCFRILIKTILRESYQLIDLNHSFIEIIKIISNWIDNPNLEQHRNNQANNCIESRSAMLSMCELECFKILKNWIQCDSMDLLNHPNAIIKENAEHCMGLKEDFWLIINQMESLLIFERLSFEFIQQGISEWDLAENYNPQSSELLLLTNDDFNILLRNLELQSTNPFIDSLDDYVKLFKIWPEILDEPTERSLEIVLCRYLNERISDDKSQRLEESLIDIQFCRYIFYYKKQSKVSCSNFLYKLDPELVKKLVVHPILCIITVNIMPYQFLNELKLAPEIAEITISDFIDPGIKIEDKTNGRINEFVVASHMMSLFKMYDIIEYESLKQSFVNVMFENKFIRGIILYLIQNIESSDVLEENTAMKYDDLLTLSQEVFDNVNLNFYNLNLILISIFAFVLKIAPRLITEMSHSLASADYCKLTGLIALLSPLLYNQVVFDLHENPIDDISIIVSTNSRKITVRYDYDDIPFEIFLEFAEHYPIVPIELSFADQKIENNLLKSFSSELRTMLTVQKMDVCRTLRRWHEMLDKKLSSLEQCIICYSVLHIQTKRQPDQQCFKCKKIFHGDCLVKWLKASVQPGCPHCREPFEGFN